MAAMRIIPALNKRENFRQSRLGPSALKTLSTRVFGWLCLHIARGRGRKTAATNTANPGFFHYNVQSAFGLLCAHPP